MSPAETDEPIEMPFAVWTWVAPMELLSWGLGPLGERAIWEDNLAANSRV